MSQRDRAEKEGTQLLSLICLSHKTSIAKNHVIDALIRFHEQESKELEKKLDVARRTLNRIRSGAFTQPEIEELAKAALEKMK